MAALWPRTIAEKFVEHCRCIHLHSRRDVGIAIERHLDTLVPEPLLDDFRVHAGLEHEGGHGVAHAVGRQCREFGALDLAAKRLSHDIW